MLKVARAKSTGTQAYGVDVRLPGMLTAVVVRPPVFNGKVASFDAAAAKAVKGVKAVLPVTLDRGGQGLAIVADGYWPAKMGRDALKVEWNLADVEKVDSARLLAQYRELAKQTGATAPQPQFQAGVAALASAPKKLSAEYRPPMSPGFTKTAMVTGISPFAIRLSKTIGTRICPLVET